MLDLLGNGMETVCRLGGFLCQLLIIGQVIVLYIGKGSGQRSINGKAQSVLIGKRPFPVFLPFPIIPILALASGLRVLLPSLMQRLSMRIRTDFSGTLITRS